MKSTLLTVVVTLALASSGAALAACSSGAEPSALDEAALAADATTSADGGSATDGSTEGGDGSADGSAPVTFAVVEPILAAKCSSCHHQDFATLAGVKAKRADMIAKISEGKMPKNEPDWRTSADGVLVLHWLQTSPELQ
jgi:hypothetical protein